MAERKDISIGIDIVGKFAEVIKKEIKVNNVILYGSYAKGKQHKDSDIDIAVISPDFSGDRTEDQFRLLKYRRNIDLRIEPMPFRPEDFILEDPFVREIVETGIVVV